MLLFTIFLIIKPWGGPLHQDLPCSRRHGYLLLTTVLEPHLSLWANSLSDISLASGWCRNGGRCSGPFQKGCHHTKQGPFPFALQERLFHFPISFNRRLMPLSPLWKTAVRCLTCLFSLGQCLLVLHREDTMCGGKDLFLVYPTMELVMSDRKMLVIVCRSLVPGDSW